MLRRDVVRHTQADSVFDYMIDRWLISTEEDLVSPSNFGGRDAQPVEDSPDNSYPLVVPDPLLVPRRR